MAEMTTLVAAIYRKYSTRVRGDFGTVTPAITSRFELFYDEACDKLRVCIYVPSFDTLSANPPAPRNMSVLLTFKNWRSDGVTAPEAYEFNI